MMMMLIDAMVVYGDVYDDEMIYDRVGNSRNSQEARDSRIWKYPTARGTAVDEHTLDERVSNTTV